MSLTEPFIQVRKYRKDHPWIFSNEIVAQKKDITPGTIVDIYKGDRFIGCGFYNPHSLIALRRYAVRKQEFNTAFIQRKISQAIAYRASILNEKSYRAVFSESDGLPGLIVDKYENIFVLQVHSYGIQKRLDDVIGVLAEYKPVCVYERSEGTARLLEGLAPFSGPRYGSLAQTARIQQDGIQFIVDIAAGQKTGFFFDLRDARRLTKQLAKGKRVLDLFCYSGSFSLYAAQGEAQSVVGVDASPGAIDLARKNAHLNKVSCITFYVKDVFDFLRNERTQYDLIVLDPPAFAKTRKEVTRALRGYKEIHVQALRILAPAGILITTCCAYHVSESEFAAVVRRAARDARRSIRIQNRISQAADHPILLAMPESHYLKGFVLKDLT